jgi:hypothetical protein
MTDAHEQQGKVFGRAKGQGELGHGGATSMIPTAPMVPAMNEPNAAIPSAAPARPFSPSAPVQAGDHEAASPGIRGWMLSSRHMAP